MASGEPDVRRAASGGGSAGAHARDADAAHPGGGGRAVRPARQRRRRWDHPDELRSALGGDLSAGPVDDSSRVGHYRSSAATRRRGRSRSARGRLCRRRSATAARARRAPSAQGATGTTARQRPVLMLLASASPGRYSRQARRSSGEEPDAPATPYVSPIRTLPQVEMRPESEQAAAEAEAAAASALRRRSSRLGLRRARSMRLRQPSCGGASRSWPRARPSFGGGRRRSPSSSRAFASWASVSSVHSYSVAGSPERQGSFGSDADGGPASRAASDSGLASRAVAAAVAAGRRPAPRLGRQQRHAARWRHWHHRWKTAALGSR